MVAKADGNELVAIRGAEVEAVGRFFVAKGLLLKFHDCDDGFDHRFVHLFEGVCFLPGVLGAAVGEVGDVEGRGVLGVGAAEDVAVGVVAEEIGHVAADVGEVRDGAVVHEGVAAEDEGVAVDLSDDAAAGGADVGKEAVCLGVGT